MQTVSEDSSTVVHTLTIETINTQTKTTAVLQSRNFPKDEFSLRDIYLYRMIFYSQDVRNIRIRSILIVIVAFGVAWPWSLQTEAFPTIGVPRDIIRTTSTTLSVLAEPSRDASTTIKATNMSPRKKKSNRKVPIKKKPNRMEKEDVRNSGRWTNAVQVETKILEALDRLEILIKEGRRKGDRDSSMNSISFPTIRECNAALAAFGDGEDLLRALRLYFKMRKTVSLCQRYYSGRVPSWVPTPTLVTFSTMMSRAVKLGKPMIAIRLWNTMRRQTDFFSAVSSVPQSYRIVPDVKAANILMNCYAKLGYLDSARDLLQQMLKGDGEDAPRIQPNIVTFNTLLDSCFKAGELDVALSVKNMLEASGIMPDQRTYTTLIATVARKPSMASGVNDPTLAFTFLEEMQSLDIRPNGMTYSALIDVCGRCRRSDLALKGLRLMEDQKAHERQLLNLPQEKRHSLPAEVGAWTAAIKACGRTPGKIESAIKLFYAMPNFGVYPNTVTCGCLADCLLRQGRTTESLEVLRYMKKNGISPSEVMYTSLMTSASRLAQSKSEHSSAVQVYSELMQSLVELSSKKDSTSNNVPLPLSQKPVDNSELYQVSLVFQEMKAAGVEPDLACYNAMLKSCANVGDVQRASEILESIRSSKDMEPNDKTWRHIIQAAGKANRIDIALSTWKVAIKELNEVEGNGLEQYRLSAKSAVALLEALIQGSNDAKLDRHTRLRLYQLVVNVCEATITGSNYLGMNLVDRESVLNNSRAMITFLHALVTLEQNACSMNEKSIKVNPKKLRLLAISIAASGCFDRGLPYRLQQYPPYVEAHSIATKWWDEEKC